MRKKRKPPFKILLVVGALALIFGSLQGSVMAQGEAPATPALAETGLRLERLAAEAAPRLRTQRPDISTAVAAQYSITMIEPPPAYERSRGLGLNNSGQIVGRFYNINPGTENPEDRQAYFWDPVLGVTLLPTLSGETSAWGLNDSGFASGYSYNGDGFQRAARWDTGLGTVDDLGTLANTNGVYGDTSDAYDLNNLGHVMGLSDIPNLDLTFTPFHPFYFDDTSGMVDLETLITIYPEWQNGYGIAYDINELGQSVGLANANVDGYWVFRPFICTLTYDGPVLEKDMQELSIDPAYPYNEWYAVAINDSGLIGGHVIAATNQSLPHYWANPSASPVAVTMPVGFPYGEIYGMNASGEMVGIMWDSDAPTGAVEHAFFFDTVGGVQDLNDLIDPASGWELNFARDINDAGQIVGTGTYEGEMRAFLLTPVEPQAPVDFDGDGTSDVVVFRGGAWRFFDYDSASFDHGVWTGTSPGCVPAPMDYDGDGGVEPTQLCSGSWHFYNDDGSYNKGIWTGGVAGDLPVPADYDGDGTDDVVIWRNGAWRFFDFATGAFDRGVWTGSPPHWLGGTNIPVPMDYNGDAAAEFSVFSGGPWHFYNDDGTYAKGIWTGGVSGDLPVPADYDGDGVEEVVIWRTGAWRFFDYTTATFVQGIWTGSPPHWLGGASLPSPIDYDGDGDVDFTVFSGGPWHFYDDAGAYAKGIWTGGVAGDLPISRRLLP